MSFLVALVPTGFETTFLQVSGGILRPSLLSSYLARLIRDLHF